MTELNEINLLQDFLCRNSIFDPVLCFAHIFGVNVISRFIVHKQISNQNSNSVHVANSSPLVYAGYGPVLELTSM